MRDSVCAMRSSESRFKNGDCSSCEESPCRNAPSKTGSPVELAKSASTTVSLSVSLAGRLETRTRTVTSSSPAAASRQRRALARDLGARRNSGRQVSLLNSGRLRRWAGFAIVLALRDRCNKTVSPLGYSLDISLALRSFAQHFAQCGDIDREVGLFHKAVRPHLLHEFVLRQQPAVALNQGDQDLERFRRQRNRLALAQEEMFPGVQAEFSKFVQDLCFQDHDCLWNFLGIYLEILDEPLRTILSDTA